MTQTRRAFFGSLGAAAGAAALAGVVAACGSDPGDSDAGPGDGCDKFSSFVGLDGTFRAYLVPFDGMQQGGWGMRSPGLDMSELFSFALEYGRGSWDLWIDDIGFYRRRR